MIVAVRATPVDGEANAAVLKVLCDVLHGSKSSLVIVRGHKSRDKLVRVRLSRDEVRRHLST